MEMVLWGSSCLGVFFYSTSMQYSISTNFHVIVNLCIGQSKGMIVRRSDTNLGMENAMVMGMGMGMGTGYLYNSRHLLSIGIVFGDMNDDILCHLNSVSNLDIIDISTQYRLFTNVTAITKVWLVFEKE